MSPLKWSCTPQCRVCYGFDFCENCHAGFLHGTGPGVGHHPKHTFSRITLVILSRHVLPNSCMFIRDRYDKDYKGYALNFKLICSLLLARLSGWSCWSEPRAEQASLFAGWKCTSRYWYGSGHSGDQGRYETCAMHWYSAESRFPTEIGARLEQRV